MINLKKKGQILGTLSGLAVGLAGFAIVMVVTFLIISQARTQVISTESINTTNTASFTTAFNATNKLGEAISSVPDWTPLIVITVVGAALIGLVAIFRRGR